MKSVIQNSVTFTPNKIDQRIVNLQNRIKIIIIVVSLLVIIILLYCSFTVVVDSIFTAKNDSNLRNKNMKADQYVGKFQQTKMFSQQIQDNHLKYFGDLQKNCPNVLGLFHVHMTDTNKSQVIPYILQKRARKCQIPIYGIRHLKQLISKWDYKYPDNKIKTEKLAQHSKKMLLIFLQLYYYAGTYVDHREILSSIHNRCWKLAIIDFDILFASTKEILENGVRLPDFQKFIRVKYPYTPMIKKMIEDIINGHNYDGQCRLRQCIIVECIRSSLNQIVNITQYKQSRKSPSIQNNQRRNQAQSSQVYGLIQNVEYNIYSYLSSTSCLDVDMWQNPHQMVIYKCLNSSNQRFKFISLRQTTYKVKSVKNMDQTMKIDENTKQIIFDKENQSSDQLWTITPVRNQNYNPPYNLKNAYFVRSVNTQLAMNLKNQKTQNLNKLIAYDFNKGKNQIWIIVPAYRKQLQFQTYEDYVQNLVTLFIYPNDIVKKIEVQYLKKRMLKMSQQQPFWMNVNIPPQPQDLPIFDENALQKLQKEVKFPKSIFFQCAKNHTITYMWFGTKQMPAQYQQIITKCKDNVKLLNQKDYEFYIEKWNSYVQDDWHKVDSKKLSIRNKLDLLKLIYLFFESGIYSDFDTQINQKCFQNVYTDEIIWTSKNWIFLNHIVIPQENFIMVKDKLNPQIKRMILNQLYIGYRWNECVARQCLIINCQRHYQDNTYKKGYD